MRFLSTLLLLSLCYGLTAQVGCPGCTVALPALSADTLYIGKLPDGEQGKAYTQEISFRMPKTTTPVASIDPTTPPGLPISKIEILGVDSLPDGLMWQASKMEFNTGNGDTDGCVRFCGIPLQADSFSLRVRIKATVFVVQKESSFTLRLYIAPKKKITTGFTMTGFEGCDNTTVRFTNNVPSKNKPGFTYLWNFGDGTTFTGENPPPHRYTTPGKYPVSYRAIIDTTGPVLEKFTILAVDCTDLLNAPDLYCVIKNPGGVKIYDSSPDIPNATLPLSFFVNLPLNAGNYTLEVIDEDSGVAGGDDPCGSMPFNVLSKDTLVAGGLKLVLTITRPQDTITSVDTVTVFAPADKPAIIDPFGLKACVGRDSVILLASYPDGITWWTHGKAIPGADKVRFRPLQSGWYRALHTNRWGCSTFSDSVQVSIHTPPPSPLYRNDRNVLTILNPPGTAPEFTYQWYQGSTPLAGATKTTYCARTGGNIGVEVRNTVTGCSSFYAASVQLDPLGVNCAVSTGTAEDLPVLVYPNPALDRCYLQLSEAAVSSFTAVSLVDVTGKVIHTQQIAAPLTEIERNGVPSGLYLLRLTDDAGYARVLKIVWQ